MSLRILSALIAASTVISVVACAQTQVLKQPVPLQTGAPPSVLAMANVPLPPINAPTGPAGMEPHPRSLPAVVLQPQPLARLPEVDQLATAMREALGPVLLADVPAYTHVALPAARTMLQKGRATIDRAQVLFVVDRSPKVQRLWVVVAYPGGRPWDVLGQVHVSTGKPGRKEHFRTPVGVFQNDTAILGYRAQGTYNENHIRGIGIRGMRVWDFGWQTTDDWRTPGAPMAVRMEMHATDPAVLEPRLGRWDSEGCIRIPTRFNSFIDHAELIDAKLRTAAMTERRFAALLPKDGSPSPLAGDRLVVIDSSDPTAQPSDPVRAQALEHPPSLGPEHDDAS
jgi:hypothetical protein